MNKTLVLIALTLGLISCKSAENKVDKLQIARHYYKILNRSEGSDISLILNEGFTTKDDGFEHKYHPTEYVNWLKWDAVFEPTYKILSIKQENGMVRARISKIDKRILFLHKEPIVTEEMIRFDKNKISSIERNSVVFNVAIFIKNRDELVTWIKENFPELDGFLNDQTEFGGMTYLKAIEIYKREE